MSLRISRASTRPDTAPSGKIDLRYIAGDNRLGRITEACEKHLHLFGGSVLSFIENNERIIEGPASHEGQRSHFDVTPFDHACGFLEIDHVVQRIVERPQDTGSPFHTGLRARNPVSHPPPLRAEQVLSV